MKEKNIYLLKNLILFFLASFLPKTILFFWFHYTQIVYQLQNMGQRIY